MSKMSIFIDLWQYVWYYRINQSLWGYKTVELSAKWWNCFMSLFILSYSFFPYSVFYPILESNDFSSCFSHGSACCVADGDFNAVDFYLKGMDRNLVLRLVTFSRFYSICLSYPEYFDIFFALIVPTAASQLPVSASCRYAHICSGSMGPVTVLKTATVI